MHNVHAYNCRAASQEHRIISCEVCPECAASVACANECGNEVDVRRAALGKVGRQDFALCVPCNDANLTHSEDAPRISRDDATYDPAPNPRAYGVA